MTDDIIELTIYSDITHIDITNHTDIQDMSIAALSLLPRLQTVWASGGPITNLGLIMICSAQTITKLDLSKYVFSIAMNLPPYHPRESPALAPSYYPSAKPPPPLPSPSQGLHAWSVPNEPLYLSACSAKIVVLYLFRVTAGLLVLHDTTQAPRLCPCPAGCNQLLLLPKHLVCKQVALLAYAHLLQQLH